MEYLKDSDKADFSCSIKFLSGYLKDVYGKDVVILIDEYDIPLDKAYNQEYYTEMVNLINNMLNQALKTNINLNFAVLTGACGFQKKASSQD